MQNIKTIFDNYPRGTEFYQARYQDYLVENELTAEEFNIDSYIEEESWMEWEELKIDLNIEVDNNIVVIADLGLWNGRVTGYKFLGSNIADCFYTECARAKWYVGSYDFHSTHSHHDGTNFLTYRVVKNGVDKDIIAKKILNGTWTKKDMTKYTKSLKKAIAENFHVY